MENIILEKYYTYELPTKLKLKCINIINMKLLKKKKTLEKSVTTHMNWFRLLFFYSSVQNVTFNIFLYLLKNITFLVLCISKVNFSN